MGSFDRQGGGMSEVIDLQQARQRKIDAHNAEANASLMAFAQFMAEVFDGNDPPLLVNDQLEAMPLTDSVVLITPECSIELGRAEAIRLAWQILGWMDKA